jgi:hypothetical protein
MALRLARSLKKVEDNLTTAWSEVPPHTRRILIQAAILAATLWTGSHHFHF